LLREPAILFYERLFVLARNVALAKDATLEVHHPNSAQPA
jgi:hypothetical protein